MSAMDILGMIGVVLLMAAYWLITNRKLQSDDIRYHLLNFSGASLILLSIFFDWNTAAAVMEIVWMLISGWGIWRCWRTGRKDS